MAVVNELRQKIESDETFRENLLKAADEKEFFGKLREAGFDVTPKELLEAINYGESGEISDDELESVAGGGFWDEFKKFFMGPEATGLSSGSFSWDL